MKIILLGPPLAGKGTQGQLISEKLHLPRLSVGALIRKLYNEKTPEGIKASKYMLKGEAIPGDLLIKILQPWIEKHRKGFIVDNLVRTDDQLKSFDKFSKENNFQIDKIIHITIPEEEIFNRLTTRREEHKKTNRLRPDETVTALETRITVYQQSIAKILAYFKKSNNLVEISGNHSVKKVYEDLIDVLKTKKYDYD